MQCFSNLLSYLGSSYEQQQFRDLLLRLRKGESTHEDWQLLLSRQPSNVQNIAEFDDATRLFYSNEEVSSYNHNQLNNFSNHVLIYTLVIHQL